MVNNFRSLPRIVFEVGKADREARKRGRRLGGDPQQKAPGMNPGAFASISE
jgi:hypothetical protein